MKKYLIIFTLFFSLSTAVVFFLKTEKNPLPFPLPEDGLSNRAKNYIETQQKANDSFWRQFSLEEEKKNQVLGTQTQELDCFSLEIPFLINKRNDRGDCNYSFTIDSPRGNVTVFRKETDIQSLDDESGIILRRKNTDLYLPEEFSTDHCHFLIFQKNEPNYEKTAYCLIDQNLYSLTLKANAGNLDPDFFKMLSSFIPKTTSP